MKGPDRPLQVRSFWRRLCPDTLILALAVFAVLTALRIYAFWGPEFNGHLVLLGFLLMWFVPPVFLEKEGRKAIGLTLPQGHSWILMAPLAGVALGLLCYAVGILLYGHSVDNWYWTISQSFLSDERVLGMPRHQLFVMFTIPAVIFSPIGEEILFRGLIHRAVQDRWCVAMAITVNSLLFAGVHLLHHGIQKTDAGWIILWESGFLWWSLVVLTSVVFSVLRLRYKSLLPAIVAHSFFNLAMNYTIFYMLLDLG